MRVYVTPPPDLSRAMDRVANALRIHAPRGVEIVTDAAVADLVVIHVIGYPETLELCEKLIDLGTKYAIIQYCMRSTQQPNTVEWKQIWRHANLVWSYYDLESMLSADGGDFPFHFYCSPLGVDPIFTKTEPMTIKMWTALTSGYVAESESVIEVANAVQSVDGQLFHLGPRNVAPTAHMCGLGVSDPQLAEIYSRTCWVSGLRRAEGFELPAVEGLCCGARPIVFDQPHYRRWYEGFAEFIPEDSPESVTASVLEIFKRGYRPIEEEVRQAAIQKFNWKTIVPEFWEGAL